MSNRYRSKNLPTFSEKQEPTLTILSRCVMLKFGLGILTMVRNGVVILKGKLTAFAIQKENTISQVDTDQQSNVTISVFRLFFDSLCTL